jgi:ubiquinone/menaquinone biosynthesis C-methylase UbiE
VTDATARFSGRATAYAEARPSYPKEAIDRLAIGPSSVVCDLGSGTGIFTRLLLATGATVHAVEPNDDMRSVAEKELGGEPRFHSIAARAEATTLPDASVDLVTAAQAFHWFDLENTRREAARILRPNGRAVLVWNDRDTKSSPFHVELEEILVARCPPYRDLQGKSDVPQKFDAFFGKGAWNKESVQNAQSLSKEGLVRRVMSASYARSDDRDLVRDLEALFDRHAENGVVTIRYDTVLVTGRPPT